MKFIYEFEVKVEKEVEKENTIKDGDNTITTKTKTKELVPVYFAFKKASRNDRELCEEYRAACWGKAVEKGILPEAILSKSNYGSSFLEKQKKDYVDILGAIDAKRIELEKEESNKEKVTKEIEELKEGFSDLQREQLSFFENTAEVKARLKAIEWLTLNMSYFREDNTKNWEPFFKGETLAQKYDFSDKLEDNENELFLKTKDRLTFISAMFLSLGNAMKKEDIDSF